MPAEDQARTNGNGAFAGEHKAPSAGEPADIGGELRALQTACNRQASTIAALGDAVRALRTGARALKADNADLRAQVERIAQARAARAADDGESADDERSEDHIALDVSAPAAARAIATASLRGRVPTTLLESARLLASELATNSVRHCVAGADATLFVRTELTRTTVCVEVEDPGHDGIIAPRAADPVNGGGFGLQIVQALSESWGLERSAAGGTRIWARLARDPA